MSSQRSLLMTDILSNFKILDPEFLFEKEENTTGVCDETKRHRHRRESESILSSSSHLLSSPFSHLLSSPKYRSKIFGDMPSSFSVLRDDDSSSSSSREADGVAATANYDTSATTAQHIPSYEDLSTVRADEETVLQAVYDTDFSSVPGTWGCPKLQIRVRPPDADQSFCELTLSVQLGKKYPYVPPSMELLNVKGLSKTEQQEMSQQLQEKSRELAESGTVMVIELVQLVEDYLIEHNQDPNVSAWEQMKAREKEQEENRQALERQWMNPAASSISEQVSQPNREGASNLEGISIEHDVISPRADQHETLAPDIAQELARQRQAIMAASQQRRVMERISSSGDTPVLKNSDIDDDDDDDDLIDYEPPPPYDGNISRYQNDFIELGILGRGGGGEVVKVRNRLDRRICTYFLSFLKRAATTSMYSSFIFRPSMWLTRRLVSLDAIKKIILESEDGKFAKYGVVQNRKLRREVTTISRMTHTNIVRYYQAWVEGASGEGDATISEEEEDDMVLQDNAIDASDVLANDDHSDSDDEGKGTTHGWWSDSPQDHSNLPKEMQANSSNSSESSSDVDASSTSWSDEGGTSWSANDRSASHSSKPLDKFRRTDSSLSKFLEHENDHGFEVRGRLLFLSRKN